MKRTKNTIAATVAALLISGITISSASAAVRHDVGEINTTEQILKMELQGDYGLKDKTYSAGRVAAN